MEIEKLKRKSQMLVKEKQIRQKKKLKLMKFQNQKKHIEEKSKRK